MEAGAGIPAPAREERGVADTETATESDTGRTPPGQRRLTPIQAAELRGKRSAGVPIKALMEEYGLSRATVHRGVGHMTVDTCGKPYLPTLHRTFKAHKMSAKVPRSSKESWCPSMAIRLGEFLEGRR
jgi:hypothetical protein